MELIMDNMHNVLSSFMCRDRITPSSGIYIYILAMLFYGVDSSAYYFHELSRVELTSPGKDSDFGFTINYLKENNNLVVGAPRSDFDGKVFTCPLTDITTSTTTSITCNQTNIEISKLAEDFVRTPTGPLDRHCHLGASLAATDDYIFTCAPLCSKSVEITNNDPLFGAYGTCFLYDGQNATRYSGLLENNDPTTAHFYGGVGWTTLSDPRNKLIIIAKSIITNYITYLHTEDPLKRVMENPMNYMDLKRFTNIGIALAAGTFFDNQKYLYAISMKTQKHTGGIAFMYYKRNTESFKLLEDDDYGTTVLITDDNAVSMFGTALHSTDLNNDNFSELIVGAPAFYTLGSGYDLGAIYLYRGGGEVEDRSEPTHRIIGTKSAARFGTAIASTDLDGDGFAEMFVSAPYGENGGTVHVLSGYEIRQLLDGSVKESLLSSLRHTQTLHIQNFRSVGYSLHAFDRNGVNLLAVGSPSTGNVFLYRSLSLVRVSMSVSVQGDQSVREQDSNFTVIVKVKLENSGKSLDSAIKLFLSTEVTGDHAKIQGNTTNEIELSKMKPEKTSNFVVLLGKTGPGDYEFTARVKDREPFNQKDYDSASVQLTPQSETIFVLDVPRHCNGSDCVPQFIITFDWSGGSEKYILGSSKSETMKLSISNVGNSTYDSCALIKVSGARIAVLECNRPDNIWYKCPLRIERNDTHTIKIRLDMSHPTNKDKSFNIKVNLFNHCASSSSNATVTKTKEITYLMNSDNIEIKGSSPDRNFTDSQIYNHKSNDFINIDETYTIINNGTISWKKLVAVLKFRDLSFVKKYMIIDREKCEKNRTEGFVEIKCFIDIESGSVAYIHTSASLSKSKLVPHLSKRKLFLNSTLELYFGSADSKFAKCSTTIFVQRDVELWENQNFIITGAVIIGLFIVVTLAIILYKVGFFQRKGKKKVKVLRESIRNKSFRGPSTAGGASVPNKPEDKQYAQL